MNQTQETSGSDSVADTNAGPDYASITPGAKPPTEYSYAERRAELLAQVEDLGHPSALNQTELAERYGVSQQQISKDLDRLNSYVRGRLGRRRDLEISSVLQRCMTGALEEGDYTAARKAAEAYDDFLDRRMDTLEFRQRIERLEATAEREGQQ